MGIMTLPANIICAMSDDIDPGNFPGTIGIFRMTAAAEFPRNRLGGTNFPRSNFMLFRRLVAAYTGNINMMGERFGPGNVGMAGFTFFWGYRRPGIVRIMTAYTIFSGIVGCRQNLRKSGGPGREILMA
jgi:hypothetical protein